MRVGELVAGRYSVEEAAGAGGMGMVYRARDRETGALVALKVLSSQRDIVEIERLSREADALAALQHPAIVRCAGMVRADDGAATLVLEWLEGETLGDRLKRQALSVAETLALGVRIADALGLAHARGIIHRDVKPSNLMLVAGDPRQVKLLDFGIARLAAASTLTEEGVTMGTPGYMAPEQAKGSREIDGRVDLYGLGAVLFHALAGRPPIVADRPMAVLMKVVLEDAPHLATLRPDVPAAIADLVARLVARDPEQRPRDGRAVAAELRRIAGDDDPGPASVTHVGLTAAELRATCLLVVAGPDDAAAAARREAVIALARGFGAGIDALGDGTLLLSFATDPAAQRGRDGTAGDAARRAARAALGIRWTWAAARIALVAARGEAATAGGTASRIGVAVRHATDLLDAAGSPFVVRLDEVAAGLLEPRFVVERDEGGPVLVSERDVTDSGRLLLGRPTPCLGRDLELGTLQALALTVLAEGAARAALVRGPAGIGKSRLVRELLDRLASQRDIGVWIGRGDPMSAGVPLALVGAMLRRAAAIPDGANAAERHHRLAVFVASRIAVGDRERVLAFAAELAGAPLSDEHRPDLAAARDNPPLMHDQLLRAWEELVVAESSRHPLVLVAEDMQWVDRPSVAFAEAALRAARGRPLLVIGVARPESDGVHPAPFAGSPLREIALGPLPPEASEALVREVLGRDLDADQVADLARRSGGNPFYLEELVRALARGAPAAAPGSVIAMAESRLEELGPGQRRALRAASVFGLSFRRRGVEALLGGASRSPELGGWLSELVERELIQPRHEGNAPGDERYAFGDALVREAAYATLTKEDQRLGHQLAGAFLESSGEPDAMLVAQHFDRGGVPERASGWYARAAEQALAASDLDAALERVARSAATGAKGELRARLCLTEAEVHDWRGEHVRGRRCATEAMTLAKPGSATWCRAAQALARACGVLGDRPALVAVTRALEPWLGTRPIPGLVAVAALTAAQRLFYLDEHALARRICAVFDDITALAATDAPAWTRLHLLRGTMAAFEGAVGVQRHEYRRAREQAQSIGDLRQAAITYVNEAWAASLLGLYGEAVALVREAVPVAERLDMRRITLAAHNNLAEALEGLGQLDEAARAATTAMTLARAHSDARLAGGSRIHLARALSSAGRWAEAEAEARGACADLAEWPVLVGYAEAVLARALLARNEVAEALAIAERAAARVAEIGKVEEGEATIRLVFAEALGRAGDMRRAREAIRVARDRLRERAAGLGDKNLAASFCHAVRDNARTFALADEWGV